MNGGVAVGLLVFKLLDAEDIGKGLEPLHPCVFEGVGGLLAQRRTVHQEQDAPEALRLQQTVDERDAGLCLARTRGHGQQDRALAVADAGFRGTDGLLLVWTQGEAIVEGCVGQRRVGTRVIALQERTQALRRVPAIERMAQVLWPPQVTEPNTTLLGQLAQIRTAVGREDERHAVRRVGAVVVGGELDLGRRPETAAVAFGLLQGRRHVDVLALGFHDGHGRKTDEEHVVRRSGLRRPFGDGQVLSALRARTLGERELS